MNSIKVRAVNLECALYIICSNDETEETNE